jgi:hypothetical protein
MSHPSSSRRLGSTEQLLDRIDSLPDELIVNVVKNVTRWDQLRVLLAREDAIADIVYEQITEIDFIGENIVENYTLYAEYPFGSPTLLDPEEDWQEIISRFPRLTEYRIAFKRPSFEDAQAVIVDPRARFVHLYSESNQQLIKWLWNSGVVEALRVRTQRWDTEFTFSSMGMYYSYGAIYLPDQFFTRWYGMLLGDEDEDKFVKYHTLIVKQYPYLNREDKIDNFLYDVHSASTIPVTTLVILQGYELIFNFADTIIFAASVGVGFHDFSQRHSNKPSMFPIIKYVNDIGDGKPYYTAVRHPDIRRRKLTLYEQAKELMTQLLDARYNSVSDSYMNLPNIKVYEVPITEEDLESAKGLFPNVKWFNVINVDGHIEKVEV